MDAQRSAAAPRLPARYYARLGLLLVEQGVPLPALLRRARLPAQRLLDREGSLQLAEVERLSRAALALFPGSDLGWRLGASIPPAEHATLGHALLAAPDLDAALRLAARYFALLSPGFVLRYHPGPLSGRVEVQPRLAFGARTLRLHLDVILIALLVELAHLHGKALPPLSIHAALPAPARPDRQPQLRRHRCHFDQGGLPGFMITLPAALLHSPRRDTDPGARELARGRLEAERDQIRSRAALGDWVAMLLREAEDGFPSQSELAALRGLSTRSFTRALADEGLRFRELANAARIGRARALLEEGKQSITAIAMGLGYGDPANFSRAFRRAVGCAPSGYRAACSPDSQRGNERVRARKG